MVDEKVRFLRLAVDLKAVRIAENVHAEASNFKMGANLIDLLT